MLSLYSIYGGENNRDDGETEMAGGHSMWALLLSNYSKMGREVNSGLSGREE